MDGRRVYIMMLLWCVTDATVHRIASSHAVLEVDEHHKNMKLVRLNVTDEIDMGLTIPNGTESTPCSEGDTCINYGGLAKLVVTTEAHCQRVVWTVIDPQITELKDCVILKGHWYGGGEQFTQPWPVENNPRPETPYVTSDMLQRPPSWYGGVTESYWISSNGVALIVDEMTPLFLSLVDEDDDGIANSMCLSAKYELPFSAEESQPLSLDYSICSADDVRQVHEATMPMFYDLPSSSPDERMFSEPIWCTWAEYKTDINQTKVLNMAYDIINRGYIYSQLEIDDDWETCYGEATFVSTKFPDPKAMTDELHSLGFRVTLWIHPFINDNCPAFTYADQNGFLVKDTNNITQITSWWQGDSSGIVDFTNPAAVAWWVGRLQDLKANVGIDSFKFDAGETNWLPEIFTLNADKALWPNIYSTEYVNAVSTFGGLIEVRTGRRNQNLPIFFRMLDKNSNWTYQNGLKTLITTLLHFGIVGYPFVLPDMIGGNAYAGLPSEELFIRWTQANALMPSMQFSLLPWGFGEMANEVAVNISQLHFQYMPQINQAITEATISYTPINRPTWWLCPTEEACLTADQQYLLGDDILVAPITDEGATEKNVVIPPGDWQCNIDGQIYTGPSSIVISGLDITSLPILTRVNAEVQKTSIKNELK